MILIFIFIFSIVGAFVFQDPGYSKNKNILIDEFHSEWEDSITPLDKQWYGMLSTYNYYSWVNWLNYYYNVDRNINETLNRQFLNNYDIRTLIDDRDEKIGKKIRDNELKKIPYMLVVGEKEAENETISVRKQGVGDQGEMKIRDFADLVKNEVKKQIAFIEE